MTNENLWGKFTIIGKKSPKSILEEQAHFLASSTQNILKGEINEKVFLELDNETVRKFAPITQYAQNIIRCTFIVVAPKMNQYKMSLFDVIYSIVDFYPLIINDKINDKEYECNTQEEYIEKLASVIQSENVRRLIENLIVQNQ